MCAMPERSWPDLNINLLGLAVRQHILVQAGGAEVAEPFAFGRDHSAPRPAEVIQQHERRWSSWLSAANARWSGAVKELE